MNAKPNVSLRTLAIGLVFAIGIATTISSGGGGGGGDSGGSGGGTEPQSDLLTITSDNAHDVSSALIVAIGLSFDISDITGAEIQGPSVAGPTGLLKLMRVDDLPAKVETIAAAEVESCLNGGTVTINSTLADPNTLTVGDLISAVFADCDDGEGYVISGAVDMTVSEIQGDIFTDVFLLGLDILLTNVEITEGAETITADGDITLTVDTLGFPVIVENIKGSNIRFAKGPDVLTFTDFDHVFQVDIGVDPEAVLVTVGGQLDSAQLGGAIIYTTTIPIEAFGDDDPHSGEILITGAEESTVRIVIHDSSSITLEVDTNGDGVVDTFIDTTFAALNGYTSRIYSSTAPTVAREIIHAVTGFGSLAVTPGGQFLSTAPFGQIQMQSLSGDFGPVEIDCAAGGSATVSGFIGTAETFSSNDMLLTTFAGCGRNNELLNGQMDFNVSSFTANSEDMYQVSGSVTEASLERTAAGNTYIGAGVFGISYDHRFTSSTFVFASANSPSFTIGYGGVDRFLSDASVSAEISIGTSPVTISRSSSGVLASVALSSDLVYQSVIPDEFVFDEDPATGPFSGELLVTADDGSMLRIFALDQLNVRLDVDYEGDSIIDMSIDTTWATLQ